MIDVEEYLVEKGCNVKPAGSGNIRTHCFFHQEEDHKAGRLYVQVEDPDRYGLFFCFVCGEKGGLNALRSHFGDPPVDTTISEATNLIYEKAAAYYHDGLFTADNNYTGYLYLDEERGLTDEMITQAKLGFADGNLKTYLFQEGFTADEMKDSGLVKMNGQDFFPKGSIVFPYKQDGRVVQLRYKEIGGAAKGLKNVETSLYGIDSINGENVVFVCEGEIDCLTLQQMGYSAVGVPGALQWKDSWTEALADAKRVYIMFDQDPAGRSGAEKIAGILGPKARIVNLPSEKMDVNKWYVKEGKRREDFDYLLVKAKGGLLVSPMQAFERWTEIEGNPDLQGLRFGIPALDNALNHGMLGAAVGTMIARTNSGKTIWTLNMLQRMRQVKPDIKILYFSLEQTRNEWFERAHRINNFYNPGASTFDTVNFWRDNLIMVDKNRVTRLQVEDCIEQAMFDLEKEIDLVVVDYLGYFARSFPGNAKEQTTDAIFAAKEMAKDYRTRFWLPHQANRTGDIGGELTFDMAKDAAAVEETSDLMLSLFRPAQASIGKDEESSQNEGDLFQRILKSRDGGVNTLARYIFAPLTLAIVPVDDPLIGRAMDEWAYKSAGDTWRQAVERHKTGTVEL